MKWKRRLITALFAHFFFLSRSNAELGTKLYIHCVFHSKTFAFLHFVRRSCLKPAWQVCRVQRRSELSPPNLKRVDLFKCRSAGSHSSPDRVADAASAFSCSSCAAVAPLNSPHRCVPTKVIHLSAFVKAVWPSAFLFDLFSFCPEPAGLLQAAGWLCAHVCLYGSAQPI